MFDEDLKEGFANTNLFYKGDINKFVLMLQKGAYPYEYMDALKKFNDPSLSKKEEFYSNLNMDDITDEDYNNVKRLWEDFEIKNSGEYHDLFV